jgi:chromosome segregation ATPase
MVQRQLDRCEKDLAEAESQCKTWQQEARDCVARYGSDDQKTIQKLRDTVQNLEETLKEARDEAQQAKQTHEALKRDKVKLEKVCWRSPY